MLRDLTINSLFYNINKGIVEDFSGHGISDLKNRIARTPAKPQETFSDDPLRILRIIRFKEKFDLTFKDDLSEITSNP